MQNCHPYRVAVAFSYKKAPILRNPTLPVKLSIIFYIFHLLISTTFLVFVIKSSRSIFFVSFIWCSSSWRILSICCLDYGKPFATPFANTTVYFTIYECENLTQMDIKQSGNAAHRTDHYECRFWTQQILFYPHPLYKFSLNSKPRVPFVM